MPIKLKWNKSILFESYRRRFINKNCQTITKKPTKQYGFEFVSDEYSMLCSASDPECDYSFCKQLAKAKAKRERKASINDLVAE